MNASVAELFENSGDIDFFKRSVVELGGAFNFEVKDMIDLGDSYFELYPDDPTNRNLENIRLGYQAVRICIIEKIIQDLDENLKILFRKMLHDVTSVDKITEGLVKSRDRDCLLQSCRDISDKLDAVNRQIDSMTFGMIKERFIGGITNIFNIMYLFRTDIENTV